MLSKLLDLIFPKQCLCCKKIGVEDQFCHDCWSEITFIQKPYCVLCGIPLPYEEDLKNPKCLACFRKKPIFNQARSLVVYDGPIKRAILSLKHHDQTQNAKRFAVLLHNMSREHLKKVDLIVPIPLHWTRLFSRQFNQAGLIAKYLGILANKPVCYDALKRIKRTISQGHKSRSERQKNMKGAFELKRRGFIKGKHVLIIDDVMTTGSTLEEASLALKEGSPRKISCLCLARAILGQKQDSPNGDGA